MDQPSIPAAAWGRAQYSDSGDDLETRREASCFFVFSLFSRTRGNQVKWIIFLLTFDHSPAQNQNRQSQNEKSKTECMRRAMLVVR